MPVMFKTSRSSPVIEAREIIKATEKTVTFLTTWATGSRNDRENRVSEWHRWFDTWEEAHDYLLERTEETVVNLRRQLERANGELGNIKGMKKPF